MRILRTIINIAATIIVCVILLFSIMNYLSSPNGKGLFGYKAYIVLSDSMSPEFVAGDYIIDKMSPYEEIESGDIITYVLETNTIITHRVTEISPEGITVQGDSNDNVDETLVTADNYIGTQTYMIPGIGKLLVKLQTPLVLIVIGVLMALYLLYLFFRGQHKEASARSKR
ncbi:MAG: signal peptidase I [Lachnospiraceae bacterium]